MPADTSDLEAAWKDIRPDLEVKDVASDEFEKAIKAASDQAAEDLRKSCWDLKGVPISDESLAEITGKAVRFFMQNWLKDLRSKGVEGILPFMVEGLSLTPAEMKMFVRALPDSIIYKVVEGAYGRATGVHALFSLEEHWRRRHNLTHDYVINHRADGVYVEFIVPSHEEGEDDKLIEFKLDERFNVI
jgi:hypothetical protein